MPRNPRYDVLFQPVQIGPKVAKNRFFQVPHASGMTNAAPHVRAAFRGMKVRAAGASSVPGPRRLIRHPTTRRFRLPPCGTGPISRRMR